MRLFISNRASAILYSFLFELKTLKYSKILIPSNICHDVFFIIREMGFEYYFVDIGFDFCIDKEIVTNYIKTDPHVVVLYNHSYGIESVPYQFFEALKSIANEVIIIDDRCLCMPSFNLLPKDQYIDLILYSTGESKQIDIGYGGFGYINKHISPLPVALFFKSKYLDLKHEIIRGSDKLFHYESNVLKILDLDELVGFNEEKYVSQVLTKIGLQKSDHFKIRDIYFENLSKEIQFPMPYNNWRFNILVKDKEFLLGKIFSNGFYASGHFPSIGTIKNRNCCLNANRLFKHVINLFIHEKYTEEMAYKTVKLINESL